MSAYGVGTLVHPPQMQCYIFFQNFTKPFQMQSTSSALVVFQLSIKMDGKKYCRLWASKMKNKTEEHFLLKLFLAYPAKKHSGFHIVQLL